MPNTTSNPSLMGLTMSSTNRMSNRVVRISLQECGADAGRVVNADEDGNGDSHSTLRFLPTAFDQRTNAVGLVQDACGVPVHLLAEVGNSELMRIRETT